MAIAKSLRVIPTSIYDTVACWNCGGFENLGLLPCQKCGAFVGDCCAKDYKCPVCRAKHGLKMENAREGCPHYKKVGEACSVCDLPSSTDVDKIASQMERASALSTVVIVQREGE